MPANWWHHKLFHFHSPFWMWEVWKGRKKIYKFEYLEDEKSFLDEEKKTFFIAFKGLSFGEKIKIWQKIVGTSFKGSCTLLHCFYIRKKLEEVLNLLFYSFYLHKLTLMKSRYELTDICKLYTDLQLITNVITLLRTAGAKKTFCINPLSGLRFWPRNFHKHGHGFHSMEVREFVRGSGKVR